MDAPNDIPHKSIIKEHELKAKYDSIVKDKLSNYCLVMLSLKHFADYMHSIGQENYNKTVSQVFKLICPLLKEGDFIAHVNYNYFFILAECAHNLDALHPMAAKLHFAVRDGMEAAFGKKLYIAMGFYPITEPYTEFYDARYFANLSRKGEQYRYRESNYDMYGVSYIDHNEAFRKLEHSVHKAMKNGDFKLYLQPKVNCVTGEIISAEALVRWIDPERGMIPLSDFLPQMEKNGYIRDLDCYLFNIACSYMDKWYNKFGKKINISFNLDRAYFNGPYFMPEYSEVFEKYKIPPDCVCIELLESIVLDDIEKLGPLVKDIYDYGFTCALDDFGSGFSSFSVLTSVQLSELKIDRSLFRNIESREERMLIKHIVDIAHDLGMVCVAEGVETEDYADYLKQVGCDFIQGFLYYKPMPIEEFEKLIL